MECTARLVPERREGKMINTLRDLESREKLRLFAAAGMVAPAPGAKAMPKGPGAGAGPVEDDETGLNSPEPQMPGSQVQDPALASAPYVRLLTKLGYEFQGHDEDVNGNKIGSSFTGQDGDTIMVKPDQSWTRFGPGAARSQGKDVPSLGQSLVKGTLAEGDDQNHHSALRQAGYQKIHKDEQGNTYYKHPQSGKSVTVRKDGSWGSSVGTGRGAGKLREFLGNEQLDSQDPQVMKTKLQQQQIKQQAGPGGRQQGPGAGARPQTGTRGVGGTRPGGGMGGGRF